jgi:hypothetical protein
VLLVHRNSNGGPDSLEKIAATLGVSLGSLFDVNPVAPGPHQRSVRANDSEATLHILRGIQTDIAEIKRTLADGRTSSGPLRVPCRK